MQTELSGVTHLVEGVGLTNRSLMEIATYAEVLLTIPPLRKYPRIVGAAARLGGSYDDCFDFAVDRRAAQLALLDSSGGLPDFLVDFSYFSQYQKAWDRLSNEILNSGLDEREQMRLLENSCGLITNLAVVENSVLAVPSTQWTVSFIQSYREAVCLEWAIYFVSLVPGIGFRLENFREEDGWEGPKRHYGSILNGDQESNMWVKKLYYGAVVYQLIGDWHGKEVNTKLYIPTFVNGRDGIGSIRKEVEMLLDISIDEAKANGMSLWEELAARYAFPAARVLANGLVSLKGAKQALVD